jgi:hypothetical protein
MTFGILGKRTAQRRACFFHFNLRTSLTSLLVAYDSPPAEMELAKLLGNNKRGKESKQPENECTNLRSKSFQYEIRFPSDRTVHEISSFDNRMFAHHSVELVSVAYHPLAHLPVAAKLDQISSD